MSGFDTGSETGATMHAGTGVDTHSAASKPPSPWMSLHHVRVSGPPGCEDEMRAFYVGVLGMAEVVKPEALRARGGAWLRSGALELHVGIEDQFVPARKAHPGIAVSDLDAVELAVRAAGGVITWDENIPGLQRFHTHDPLGNRLEFQQGSPR